MLRLFRQTFHPYTTCASIKKEILASSVQLKGIKSGARNHLELTIVGVAQIKLV